jgi:hypothetical protein
MVKLTTLTGRPSDGEERAIGLHNIHEGNINGDPKADLLVPYDLLP